MNLLFALAVSAIAGLGTIASAENRFPFPHTQQSRGWVDYDFVDLDSAGTVEIRDHDGSVLGHQSIGAGSTSLIRVQLRGHASQNLDAFLVIGGQDVASQVVRFQR